MSSKKTPNLVIVTGEERELVLRYIRRLKGQVVEDIDKLPALMTGGNLFDKEQKTFVVKDNPKIMSWELEKLQSITKRNRLVIVTDKVDKRSKLAKSVEIIEFGKLSEAHLIDTVIEKLPAGHITREDAAVLVHSCYNDLGRVENEVDKLLHLPATVDINYDIIVELIQPPLEDAIFEMLDCIASKRLLDAYDLYMDLKQLGESPIKIVSLLYTKFKQVFLVQGYADMDNKTVAGKTGLTFWQVKTAREVMGKFNEWQLIDALRKILEAEIAMKTGAVDMELAMEDLLIKLLEG